MRDDEARKLVLEQKRWEDEMIQAWPRVRAFLWGALAASLLAILLHLGIAQRHHHRDMRAALRANDIAWEACRQAEGMPAWHAKGGGWVSTAGLTAEQVEAAVTVADEWAWTDAQGKLTAWPGREDDSANDDDDACSEGWRAGYSAATEERP